MLTAKALLWSNRMEMSLVDYSGIESWFGAWVSRDSQVLSNSIAFPRSVIGQQLFSIQMVDLLHQK